MGDFYSQGVAQLNLFDDNAPRHNSEKLMKALDHLNAKDGRGTLYFAGQGIQTAWQRNEKCYRLVIRRDTVTCSKSGDSVH